MNVVMLTREDLDATIKEAARLAAEHAIKSIPRDRPVQVNYTQAAKILGMSRQKVSRMVVAGQIRITPTGAIPIGEIDRITKAA